jgi:hypothetical protein
MELETSDLQVYAIRANLYEAFFSYPASDVVLNLRRIVMYFHREQVSENRQQ